jgi:peptidoglycan-associated lipoprotein
MRSWKLILVVGLAMVSAFGCGGRDAADEDIADTPPMVVEDTTPIDTAPVDTTPAEPLPDPLALRDIYFEYDKAEIMGDARSTLDDNVRQLENHPDARITIEGHCDERGTAEYNLALGQRRAHNTMQYMVRKGVEAGRVSIISYGEERPVDPRHTEDAWTKNRRAHFVVQG